MKISNEIKSSGLSLHYVKHKGGTEVIGLQNHNERVPGQEHSNENIDDSRTADNIFLKKCGSSYVKKINRIIEDNKTTKRKVRKDAVKLIGTTVQFSGTILTLPEEEQEQVLRDSYEWLKTEFGEENIVSAVIHKDETTMHLHFDFVPMKDGRLTAKAVINRGALRRQQADFLKYIQDRHSEAHFERGGGEFNGLRQKDFEKVQAILKANEAEMKEYEEALDDRSDKLDTREENLDISEKKLNQKAEKLSKKESEISEKAENLYLREKMIVDAVGKIQSKDHELKQREDAVKIAEGFADKVNKYNQKRSEELDKRSEALNERSEAFERYVRQEREKMAKEAQKVSRKLSEHSRAIQSREAEIEQREKNVQQRESKVAELFRLLEEKQRAFERLVEERQKAFEQLVLNTKKWVNSGLVKAKHVVNVVSKGLTRVDESKDDQKQVDTVNLLNGLTDLSLETPEPDVKQQAQKTAEQLNLDFTGLDTRNLER